MTEAKVVDLSHWNETPDFASLKAAGIVGVILKATQGTSFVDSCYHDRVIAALDAGLCVAAYHFLEAGNIATQMQHFVDVVGPRYGDRLVIDHEADANLDELKQAVAALTDMTAGEVAVYSGHLIKEQLGDARDVFLAYHSDLWIAHYADTPEWPQATWPYWSLWQFTDKLKISGCDHPVDGNAWPGSDDALKQWFNKDYRPPRPEKLTCNVAINVSEGVVVKVWINGKPWKEKRR